MKIPGNRTLHVVLLCVVLIAFSFWANRTSISSVIPALAQSDPESSSYMLYLPVTEFHPGVQQTGESLNVPEPSPPDPAGTEQDSASEDQPACPLEINADGSSVSQERLEELARQGVIDWGPDGLPVCKGTVTEAVDYAALLLITLLRGGDPNLVRIPYGLNDPRNPVDTVGYMVGNQPLCPEELPGDNGLSRTQLQSLGVMAGGTFEFLYRTGDLRPICLLTDTQVQEFQQAITEAQE